MKNLQIKKHMMTAISYLIPFVCTAGMLMVIGNIAGGTSVDDFTKQISFPDFLTSLGGTGLGFYQLLSVRVFPIVSQIKPESHRVLSLVCFVKMPDMDS